MVSLENQYDNLVTAIEQLKLKGFKSSFKLKDKRLVSLNTKQAFQPGDIEIKEFHRFEGATDFQDMSILYGLETNTGEKGIIIDAFGTYANRDLGEFMKQTHFA